VALIDLIEFEGPGGDWRVYLPFRILVVVRRQRAHFQATAFREDEFDGPAVVVGETRQNSLSLACQRLSERLLSLEPRLVPALQLTSPSDLEEYDPEEEPGLLTRVAPPELPQSTSESEFRLFGRDCTRADDGACYIDFGPWRVLSYVSSHAAIMYQGAPVFEVEALDMPEEGPFFEYVESVIRDFFQNGLRDFGLDREAPPQARRVLGALARAAEEDLF
jgi:hypothetical protein